jgi:hypothetical protein
VEDKTWQKSAPAQITLDSIFAALAAIWITIAIADNIHTKLKFFEILCSLFSFFLFAASAKGTTNAYDERDVVKYVYYLSGTILAFSLSVRRWELLFLRTSESIS